MRYRLICLKNDGAEIRGLRSFQGSSSGSGIIYRLGSRRFSRSLVRSEQGGESLSEDLLNLRLEGSGELLLVSGHLAVEGLELLDFFISQVTSELVSDVDLVVLKVNGLLKLCSF